MKNIKLAEALLRRKELQMKVDQLHRIKESDWVTVKVKRQRVTDDLDDVIASVPNVKTKDLLADYDWYARQLRKIDALIQQANWTTELQVDDEVMQDFKYSD